MCIFILLKKIEKKNRTRNKEEDIYVVYLNVYV